MIQTLQEARNSNPVTM